MLYIRTTQTYYGSEILEDLNTMQNLEPQVLESPSTCQQEVGPLCPPRWDPTSGYSTQTQPKSYIHMPPPKPMPQYPPSINKSQEVVLLLANPTGLPAELESPGTQGCWHHKAVMTLCSDTRWRTAWPRHGRQCQRHLGATLWLAKVCSEYSRCLDELQSRKVYQGTFSITEYPP